MSDLFASAIVVDIAQARTVFGSLAEFGADLSPLMAQVADILQQAKLRAFATESTPTGQPWAALADSTKQKKFNGESRGGAHKLRVTDTLFNSIQVSSGADFAEIGSAVAPYPAYLQLGTSRMPAREFLGIGQQDQANIVGAAIAMLANLIDG